MRGTISIFLRWVNILLLWCSVVVVVAVVRDEERDRSIAKHVMSVHINASGVNAGAQEGDIDIATMKKFVSYCRLKCAPRLSATAATMLSSQVRRSSRPCCSLGSRTSRTSRRRKGIQK